MTSHPDDKILRSQNTALQEELDRRTDLYDIQEKKGLEAAEMFRLLDEHLDARDEVILYGHPCYEGVREAVLRRVFARVVERGFRFVTMQTMAERLQAAAPAR